MISRPSDCETQRCRSTATFSPAVIGIAQNRAQAAISCPRFANKSPMKCGEVQFRVVCLPIMPSERSTDGDRRAK